MLDRGRRVTQTRRRICGAPLVPRIAAAVLLTALAAMPACFSDDSAAGDLADGYATSSSTYTLLYSVLGYDAAST
jgi:hypothetical protein